MSNIDDIRNQLHDIDRAGYTLEPAKETIVKWKELVDDYAFNYLDTLNKEKGFSFKNNKKILGIKFNEDSQKLEGLIETLKKEYDDSGISTASGTYLGFIPGGGVYPSSLGDYIAAITNKYSGIIYGCPAAVDIENSIIKWACDLIGYPDSSTGNICSGSSTGILYSINVARDSIKAKSHIYSKLVLYCTSVCHACVFKALKVGGLADAIIRKVPTDDDFRMLPQAFENLIENDVSNDLIPFMVFSNAGSTDV